MRPQKDNVVYRFSDPWFLILCFGGWRVKHFHYTFRYLIVGSDQNQNLKLKSVFSTVKGKWKNVVETPKPVLRLYPLHGMLPLNVGGGRGGKELAIEHTTPGERHQDSRTVFPAFCFYTILQYAIPPTPKLVSLCVTLVISKALTL